MLSISRLFVNVGFEAYNNFPEGGYLKFPFSVLKTCGNLSRTYAALWAMEQGRKPIRTPAPLARNGCLPVDTIKKQLRTMLDQGTLRRCFTEKGAEYRLSPNMLETLSHVYADSMPHIQVPRIWFHFWPDATFSELLLLGFYRFKCTTSKGEAISCSLTHSQIAEMIGFSSDTWKRSAKWLDGHGLICRTRNRQGYSVTLPN